MPEPATARTERTGFEPVIVNGPGVVVERAHDDLSSSQARSRFGGVDVAAVLSGASAGLGTAVLLGAVASAVGADVGASAAETLVVAALDDVVVGTRPGAVPAAIVMEVVR